MAGALLFLSSANVIPPFGRNLGLRQRPRCLDFASLRYSVGVAPQHDRTTFINVHLLIDYVEKRMSRYQTVMTVAVANRQRVDGLAVEV